MLWFCHSFNAWKPQRTQRFREDLGFSVSFVVKNTFGPLESERNTDILLVIIGRINSEVNSCSIINLESFPYWSAYIF